MPEPRNDAAAGVSGTSVRQAVASALRAPLTAAAGAPDEKPASDGKAGDGNA